MLSGWRWEKWHYDVNAPLCKQGQVSSARDHDVDEYRSVQRLVTKLLLDFYGRRSCIVERLGTEG